MIVNRVRTPEEWRTLLNAFLRDCRHSDYVVGERSTACNLLSTGTSFFYRLEKYLHTTAKLGRTHRTKTFLHVLPTAPNQVEENAHMLRCRNSNNDSDDDDDNNDNNINNNYSTLLCLHTSTSINVGHSGYDMSIIYIAALYGYRVSCTRSELSRRWCKC